MRGILTVMSDETHITVDYDRGEISWSFSAVLPTVPRAPTGCPCCDDTEPVSAVVTFGPFTLPDPSPRDGG